jgi:pimeloyl-ACP methyl ester carboxylesterase
MSSALPGRELTEHTISTARHTTGYIASGREDRPLMIFVHGWPALSLSWRHQLPCFASLGFRAVAPDLRGYGRSSVYRDHASYALEHIVQDMLEMLDALGKDKAVWIGHDWGSPIVWSLASHHPERCRSPLPVGREDVVLGLRDRLASHRPLPRRRLHTTSSSRSCSTSFRDFGSTRRASASKRWAAFEIMTSGRFSGCILRNTNVWRR